MWTGRLHVLVARESDAAPAGADATAAAYVVVVTAATGAAAAAAAAVTLVLLGKLPKLDDDGVKRGPEGGVLFPTGLHEDHEFAGHARINSGP